MQNNVWAFNKGEWAEAYVFLRLLGNGRIYGATNGLEKDPNVYIDIVNIIRYEADGILNFQRENDKVSADFDGEVFKIICCDELCEKAEFLYHAIKKATAGSGTMKVPEIQEYLQALKLPRPKVPSLPKEAADLYGKKTDIIITSENPNDFSRVTEGFSIKSHLGSPSSLFNSATESGFIYEITGCTEEAMHNINAIKSEKEMFSYIKNHDSLDLRFDRCRCEHFEDNLSYIDLQMYQAVQTAVLVQLGYLGEAKSSMMSDIVSEVAEINPIHGVRNPQKWYEAKFKEFLFNSFSGMTATTPWDGRRKMTGGYIDVTGTGEILYYRAVSDDVFMSYLYDHTFIDRPSRGVKKDLARLTANTALEGRKPTEEEIREATYNKNGKKKEKKGDWGYVYKEDDKYYIATNFQVRFK